ITGWACRAVVPSASSSARTASRAVSRTWSATTATSTSTDRERALRERDEPELRSVDDDDRCDHDARHADRRPRRAGDHAMRLTSHRVLAIAQQPDAIRGDVARDEVVRRAVVAAQERPRTLGQIRAARPAACGLAGDA